MRDYYESMPAFVREHPQSAYPGQLAVVAMKVKILRHWAHPESTAFDDFAPCRELIPFLAMEPWIVESTLAMLRPRAETKAAPPLISNLLLVVPRTEKPVYNRPACHSLEVPVSTGKKSPTTGSGCSFVASLPLFKARPLLGSL